MTREHVDRTRCRQIVRVVIGHVVAEIAILQTNRIIELHRGRHQHGCIGHIFSCQPCRVRCAGATFPSATACRRRQCRKFLSAEHSPLCRQKGKPAVCPLTPNSSRSRMLPSIDSATCPPKSLPAMWSVRKCCPA